jgi:hypothetical protein
VRRFFFRLTLVPSRIRVFLGKLWSVAFQWLVS